MMIKNNNIFPSLLFALLLILAGSIHAQNPQFDKGDGYSVETKIDKKRYIQELQDSTLRMYETIYNILGSDGGTTAEPTPNNDTNSPTPTGSNTTLPPSTNNHQTNCSKTGKLNIASSQYKHLNRYLPCDKPRMIVIHWSGGWSSAQATFNTLNRRDRSCQFAVDENTTIQMLDFYPQMSDAYPKSLERGWCAGGDNNVGSINFEITGAWFNSILANRTQNPKKYNQLMTMTDKTVALTCKFIHMYNIPKSAIYGHYQLQKGKSDPGTTYLQFFKAKVNKTC